MVLNSLPYSSTVLSSSIVVPAWVIRGVCVSVEVILDRRWRNRKTISFPSFFLDAFSPVGEALIIGGLSFLSIFQPVWRE